MSDFDDLEEIAQQSSVRPNEKQRSGTVRGAGSGGIFFVPSENTVRAAIRTSHAPETTAPVSSPQLTAIWAAPATSAPFAVSLPVTSYTESLDPIRERVRAVLNISYIDFDDLCGFAVGMTGKAFGAAQAKRLGIDNFFAAVRGAGLRIRFEVDEEQTVKMLAQIAKNYNPRQSNQARPNNNASTVSTHLLRRAFKHLSRLGGKARMRKMTKEERSAHARHAANVRWIADRKRKRRNRARRQGAAHRAANEETRAT